LQSLANLLSGGHELETFDQASLPLGRGLSPFVRKMMWIEHLRSRADLAIRPLAGFLRDLNSASKLNSVCKKLRQDLKEQRARVFKEWQEDVEDKLKDPDDPIGLEMNSRVMEFDTSGSLRITYSERLILLVKEARLFEQMGEKIPTKVKTAVQDGLKFYRFAVQLKQICNFYNNLDAELLTSQRQMLIQPALAFEQLFNDKQSQNSMKKVQWAKLDKLEEFTRSVKEGAERLRSVNRRLRNGHQQVAHEVVQLANISLLRQRDQWKQKLMQISKSIDVTVTSCGCQPQHAKPWRAHWDYQIFKIMEVQYRFGLESLNENLSEMKADLVLTNKQLRLKPSLQELKQIYYKEIMHLFHGHWA